MKRPDLSRYEDDHLERLLYSYRSLARTHLESGHYALAKWATRMVTWVTVEMNRREAEKKAQEDAQMALYDAQALEAYGHVGD